LTTSPYSLTQGSSIFVKVTATNAKGTSVESTAGNGATIIETPDAPVSLAEDTLKRDPTTLGLTWSAGSANGGSSVTEYRINYAQ
jgi:hypothetical protein